MFTDWTKPTDHVYIVDTARQDMAEISKRGNKIILHWIPSHVGIKGNDEADKEAKTAALEAGNLAKILPDFNRLYGISYTIAKRKISEAVQRETLNRWNKTRTIYRNYNPTINSSPYQNLGSREQIGFRNGIVLGVSYLNYDRHKYGRGAADPYCHMCYKKLETVKHVVIECPLYKQPRQKLKKVFDDVHGHNDDRNFSCFGILREPQSKLAIKQHAPVIAAFNTYITEALTIRANTPRPDWSLYEDVWSSD